jgi:hypothetical protein
MGERARQRVLQRYDLHGVCLPWQRANVLAAGTAESAG